MAQSLSKIYIRINASALTGRLTDCHYTQGVALGYALVGLSARPCDLWFSPPLPKSKTLGNNNNQDWKMSVKPFPKKYFLE